MRILLHTCSSWNTFFIVWLVWFFLLLAANRKMVKAHVHTQSVSTVMEGVQERG